MIPRSPEPERGFVLAVLAQGTDADEELAEVEELARTAGVEPVGRAVQHRQRPAQRTYVGKGKIEELKAAFAESAADSLLVDDELEPAQQRYLEDVLQARVVDRTQLILDIFAQHAVTAEGKLQVELAQLEYNLPRMRGMWKHLERLGGGTGALGAGVGTRGPGESQLESDRRLARRRISLLKRRLRELERQRATRRKERRRTETPTIALAGYTNVGKSTLLNALTGAEVSVENRLFETLDPTTRGFEHDGRRYLVTDTVGFIRRLPHQLVEGFASTLEETLVADLVLHVVDASVDEERLGEMMRSVDDVLQEIGAGEVPVTVVLNKIDRLDPLARRRLANGFPDAPQVSAMTGEGLEELKAFLAARFADRWESVRMLVPYEDGARLSELYALGTPIEERRDTPEGVMLVARLPRRDVHRFAPYLVAGAVNASDRETA
jgi:GTP-binding protein HflX